MKALISKIAIVQLLVLCIPAALFAQGTSRNQDLKIAGTWKLNLTKSKFGSGPPLKSRVLTWTWDGETLTHRNDSINADGSKSLATFQAKFDGKNHPVYETVNGDDHQGKPVRYIRMKQVDPYTFETTNSRDGKDMTTYRHTISKDGKTDTIVQTGDTPEGGHGTDVLVYDRVAAAGEVSSMAH